jgi:hypothetical protein
MLILTMKIKYLLGLLVFFVVLDGVLTRFLLDGGLAREGNPLLQPIVEGNGFLLLKVAGALLCAFILWDVSRHHPRVARIATWCCVAAYAVIVVWNSSLFLLG